MTRGAARGWLWLLGLVAAVVVVSILFARARGRTPPLHKLAPTFSLPDTTGRPVSLSTFAGQDVVLRFSSVTCTVCDSDWPTLARWQRNAGAQLHILAIEVGQPADLVGLHLQGVQPSVPVLVDADSQVAGAYGVPSLPTFAFIDKSGTLVAVQPVVDRGAIWPDATWQFYLGVLQSADAGGTPR